MGYRNLIRELQGEVASLVQFYEDRNEHVAKAHWDLIGIQLSRLSATSPSSSVVEVLQDLSGWLFEYVESLRLSHQTEAQANFSSYLRRVEQAIQELMYPQEA